MKLGLINSAWLGTAIDAVRGIQLTKEIGFDTIDIFADPMELTPQELRDIREACTGSSLPVISTVCCALGIADFNTSVRQFHLARAKRYLDLAYDLRGRNLLLVVGEYLWNQEVVTPADQWRFAVQGVSQLAHYAQLLDLEIAVEIEPFPLSLVNTIEKMSRFLNDVGHPVVKANLDISHLVLAKNGAEQVSQLRGRIAHVHLSDCDGKKHGDLPPGHGSIDFVPYLQALKAAEFDGTISIELEYSPEPDKIVDWVREAYTATDTLMRTQGLRS